MANIEVLLLDQNNQPLTYTKTDVNGEYAFQNLAYGTYVVYPEIYRGDHNPIHGHTECKQSIGDR